VDSEARSPKRVARHVVEANLGVREYRNVIAIERDDPHAERAEPARIDAMKFERYAEACAQRRRPAHVVRMVVGCENADHAKASLGDSGLNRHGFGRIDDNRIADRLVDEEICVVVAQAWDDVDADHRWITFLACGQ
jgi:hypothetical protein